MQMGTAKKVFKVRGHRSRYIIIGIHTH